MRLLPLLLLLAACVACSASDLEAPSAERPEDAAAVEAPPPPEPELTRDLDHAGEAKETQGAGAEAPEEAPGTAAAEDVDEAEEAPAFAPTPKASEASRSRRATAPKVTPEAERKAPEESLKLKTLAPSPGAKDGKHVPTTEVATEAAKPITAPFDVDAFIDGLPDEAIVFNVPAEVLIDSVTQVRLLIHPGVEGEALQARFEAERGGLQTGAVSQASVPTSEEMGASLVSSGLSVTALRPERQLLSLREPTEWLWEVRANEGGQHALTLTLYAIPPGRSSGRTLEVFERQMTVTVPAGQQALGMVQDNWEWMWTFLLAPLGGWWLHRKRQREQA
ncbi:MAG: hypothetical protein H6741_06940 [Alphaproteobacteria bacterium]|nr:hypothetical protein [Alphaproteobacteria bacterium]